MESILPQSKIILNSIGGRGSVVYLAKKLGYEINKNDPVIKEKIKELFIDPIEVTIYMANFSKVKKVLF